MAGPSNNIQVIDLEELSQRRVSFVDLTVPEAEMEVDDEVIFVQEKSVISGPPAGSRRRRRSKESGNAVDAGPPSEPSSPAKGLRCPICFERKESELHSPLCGHILCSSCITKIMSKRAPVCPICRRKLLKSKIIKLHPSA